MITKGQWDLMDDENRWRWVKENQDEDFTLMLDNDDTFIVFGDPEDPESLDFDDYIGWSDGVVQLLNSVGIESQCV
jgi:hypothetical protein